MTMRRSLLALPPVLLALVLASGCGGKSSSASGGTTAKSTGASTTATTSAPLGKTLQLAADPSGALRFDKKTLSAPAGKVTIVMTDSSPVQHNIALKGNGVDLKGPIVSNGAMSKVTADLKPGTYTFYCSVDGHAAAGMTGTLTVP